MLFRINKKRTQCRYYFYILYAAHLSMNSMLHVYLFCHFEITVK